MPPGARVGGWRLSRTADGAIDHLHRASCRLLSLMIEDVAVPHAPGPAVESNGNGLKPGTRSFSFVYCGANRTLTRVTLPGGATNVSFHPLSAGEGGSDSPVRKSRGAVPGGKATASSTLALTVGWLSGSVEPFRLSQYALKRSTSISCRSSSWNSTRWMCTG